MQPFCRAYLDGEKTGHPTRLARHNFAYRTQKYEKTAWIKK